MDFLRAHADGVLLGINTLVEETQLSGNRRPVYVIEDAAVRGLREKLGRGTEKNIFVTCAAALDLGEYRVFDSGPLETFIITTTIGARRLAERSSHPHVKVIVSGEGDFVAVRNVHTPPASRNSNTALRRRPDALRLYVPRGFDRRKVHHNFAA